MNQPSDLLRQQVTVSVGSSDVQLVGPNPRRWAIVIGSPIPPISGQLGESAFAHAVDTSTTGVKLSYTVPAGVQAYLTSASMQETTGSTVVSGLEWVRGGTTTTIALVTKAGTWSGNLPLAAGDVIQWDVTTAVALSVTDFTLGLSQDQASSRVTISFLEPAVLDNGINLYPGDPPFVLLYKHVGNAIREPIHAISGGGTVLMTVIDLFG